jgi:ectoine hydroxylase-related dioxygenase (phytanoyl-CoA dioxygenase family)
MNRSSSEALKEQFDREGYVLVRGMLAPREIEEIRRTFDALHRSPPAGFYEPLPPQKAEGDPLKIYPRVMHPHRFNAVARRYLIHPRLMDCLRVLFDEEALAAQSMYYFKPPGARGQALHQDNFYLLAEPGTCVAAWTAVDDCDGENGAMWIVPQTNRMEIVCPDQADERESWTTHYVAPPAGTKPLLVPLKAGDTLFFNGSLIHGSGPNRSATRFRRAFICHYVACCTRQISRFYLPLVRRDGSDVSIAPNDSGGPCGDDWRGAAHA